MCLIYWKISNLTIYHARFVDQDMFMQFCGLGPGHKATCSVTKVFQDEIKKVFGGIADEGDTAGIPEEFEEDGKKQLEGSEDESSSEDSEESEESEEDNGEVDDDLDYPTMEDDFSYAPL